MAQAGSIDRRETGAIATGIRFLCVALTAAGVAATASATAPVSVSPGAVDRLAVARSECPTFSWGAVEGAAHYEIVAYRIPPDVRIVDGLQLSEDDEVLYSAVAGGATSWTPELDLCLAHGGRYVWFVRAVTDVETGDGSEWSEPRFFEVAAAPSVEQVRQALEVLERWRAITDEGALAVSPAAAAAPAVAVTPAAGSAAGAGSSAPKSVSTAVAAVRGSSPDPTGEAYGVVGVSASPDGAGLAAANTAGGADLVLDGSEDGQTDLRLYQWGIDRASSAVETFGFANSVLGSLDVWVQGNVQAIALIGDGTEITNVDAESLDGVDGAAYATDAEASGLVAGHAASADHDGRYFTKTQLNTSGAGGAVHWGNLTAVPAGFADGVDNEASLTAGPGIIVDGGVIRVDPGAFSTRISALDRSGIARWTSIAIGADDLALISYYNVGLRVLHCDNLVCSSYTGGTLDATTSLYTSIAIGADGLGLISYYDWANGDLKVAHCEDTVCSTASTYTLDSGGEGDVGLYTSIAIGADGLGLISYYDSTNTQLKVAHCTNTACSSAAKYLVDNVGDVGRDTSIAIGADGLGLISYYDETNGDLKVAHCSNTVCSSSTKYILDTVGDVGLTTSIAIGADGLGLISYYDLTDFDLKVAHCSNTVCSSATKYTLDSTGYVGHYSSIAIGADGLGLISYSDSTNQDLKVAHCVDTQCSGATNATIDSRDGVGLYTSIAIGADGLGLISYCDAATGHLKAAHLGIGVP